MSSSFNSEFSNINSESRLHNELADEEMDAVSGGRITELWNAFSFGLAKGWIEAGGNITILYLP
jgi:hypothetical protein